MQLKELKLWENGTGVTLSFSSNLIGDSNEETNLFLIDTQVSRIYKAFANGSSAKIKLSKTQLFKIRRNSWLFIFLL